MPNSPPPHCPLVALEPSSHPPPASAFPLPGLHTRGSFCLESLSHPCPTPSSNPLRCIQPVSASVPFLQEAFLPPFVLIHTRAHASRPGTSLPPSPSSVSTATVCFARTCQTSGSMTAGTPLSLLTVAALASGTAQALVNMPDLHS